jgi:hypothetical protein
MGGCPSAGERALPIRQHTSAYASMRQHTSAYVRTMCGCPSAGERAPPNPHAAASVFALLYQ